MIEKIIVSKIYEPNIFQALLDKKGKIIRMPHNKKSVNVEVSITMSRPSVGNKVAMNR